MADQLPQTTNNPPEAAKIQPKSTHAEREEKVLSFWKEKGIFEKTLEKNKADGKEFTFYEGPPTANGLPGIHHLEARAFKDAIPRYKTMRGFHVRRKGGWDTHGLPVELQVEKALGFKSKKDIEAYGIGAFNDKCRESVWKNVKEWESFTDRMGYWVDLKDPYITYKPSYMESLWNIVKTVDHKKLLYKDYKVVPWCPRCGTGLSSHELAQGYKDVKDLAVTVKFKLKLGQKIEKDLISNENTFVLAWTTTPWTLPGNVGLAVNPNILYAEIEKKDMGDGKLVRFILAKDLLGKIFPGNDYTIIKEVKGHDLVGLSYEPLYPFLKDNISGAEKEKLPNAYKVYAADFVTTTDGTGIVHTAVMYGQDDFELGTKVGLPKYHLVNEDGTFKKEVGFLAGLFVKNPDTDVAIIKDLAHRGLLFHKEKYEHSYPFCWRCQTPLIYFARDSWYIRMSSLRNDLIKENEGIHWEPEHIKEGRFGEWLREVKDWAISRERYWGTPLPIWICETCHERKVVGSVAEIAQKPRNNFLIMRHGEAGNNIEAVLNSGDRDLFNLTTLGEEEARDAASSLKGKSVDFIYTSPFARTRQTTKIVQLSLGLSEDKIIIDDRIHEINFGEFDGKKISELAKGFPFDDRFSNMPNGAEKYSDVKKRMGDFLHDIDQKYSGQTILIITHATPAMMLLSAARGLDRIDSIELDKNMYIGNAEVRPVEFSIVPHDEEYELDLHRPYIDAVKLTCNCGGTMTRVKEVMDVWFDSGAMPFAQDHYPFEKEGNEKGKTGILGRLFPKSQDIAYPADFISEAIDQTRGWFYTLHAIGILMGKGKAYKNVICLGHILDAKGKKMSKSLGNVVNPWDMMNKYGADALRFWMYSVNQPGDAKNFDEKTVDEIVKKVFNLAANVATFYGTYGSKEQGTSDKEQVKSQNVLDQWIVTRLDHVIETVTKGMENYVFLEPTRSIRDFIGDLSQWYLRRSRDRFKGDNVADKEAAVSTMRYVLVTLSKVMAPFTPFFADYLYKEAGGELESVHLEEWPVAGDVDKNLLEAMVVVRELSSKGLEARMNSKINVRQPLQTLRTKIQDSGFKIQDKSRLVQIIELIKDEVNVKEVSFGAQIETDVQLDVTMTPELKEEGMTRELIRAIQDLRKEKGLSVSDVAMLTVETNEAGQKFIEKNKAQLMATCTIKEVKFGNVVVEGVMIGEISFKLSIEK